MKCYECGKEMRKVSANPEIYECECGYAIKRLTTDYSNLYVKISVP